MSNHQVIQVIYPVRVKLNRLSIQQQLQQFLFTQLRNLETVNLSHFTESNNPISLFRLPKIDSITYRCAIALQLSRHSSLSPITLALEFFDNIQRQPTPQQDTLYLNFNLKLLDSGSLEFTLCDRSLILWLQSWQHLSYAYQKYPIKSREPDNLWPIQYTYSRCCSLLRLGEQEKLIKIKNSNFQTNQTSWSILTVIPWEKLELNQLERSLIAQIVATVDSLEKESNSSEMKLGLALSEAFLTFERFCRIFGSLSQTNPQLSQARLGLVAITQYLLQGLWLSQVAYPPQSQL
ncbi:MAG: arginyl-tRNA synthetase [Crocosphaera sp.]|nr:arginyl-tRNA synthetase [Crocosphaera sp.]